MNAHLKRNLAVFLGAGLILFLLVAASVGVAALLNYRANQKTGAARLALQAGQVFDEHPQLGLLLTIESARRTLSLGTTPAPEIETLLRHELASMGGQDSGTIMTPLTLNLPAGDVSALALSRDSRRLAAGSRDGTILVWDLADPSGPPLTLTGQKDAILGLAFTRDDRLLFSASWDGTLHVWDLTAGDPSATSLVLDANRLGMTELVLSPDDAWLAVDLGDDHLIHLLDLRRPTPPLYVLRADRPEDGGFYALTFCPDSSRLAAVDNQGVIHLWDLTSEGGLQQTRLSDPLYRASANQLVFTPDSRKLIAGDRDNLVLWDLQTSSLTPILRGGQESFLTPIALSPDGRRLVSAGMHGLVRMWNTADPAAAPAVHAGAGVVDSLAISPDGSRLVTASQDGISRLWNLNDLSSPSVDLPDGEARTYFTAFTSDGRWLITAGGSTVRLRLLSWPALLDLACETAGRNLTAEEWQQYFPGQAYRRTCPLRPAATPLNTTVTPVFPIATP